MSDFDEADREMVEMIVAARHSVMPGAEPDADLQDICHFRRVTAAVRKT